MNAIPSHQRSAPRCLKKISGKVNRLTLYTTRHTKQLSLQAGASPISPFLVKLAVAFYTISSKNNCPATCLT